MKVSASHCAMNDHRHSYRSLGLLDLNRSRCSLHIELLRLLVKCGALLDGNEALDPKLLAGLLNGHSPTLDVLVSLLACSRRCTADDLPRLALDEIRFLEPTRGLCLEAKEDGYLTALALGNLRLGIL